MLVRDLEVNVDRMTRRLGRDGIDVSALGMGCWAIGGPWQMNGSEAGWGPVDDAESVRAVRAALEAGITLFDTAATYGAGHSERIVGEALAGRRDEAVISTKFGYLVDEASKTVTGMDVSPSAIKASCDDSLRRLATDRIDLYWLHVGDLPIHQAGAVTDVLEELVTAGKIRSYGWSTDDPERAEAFAKGPHDRAVQHQLNVLEDNPAMLEFCQRFGLASVNRGPLAMGLLTGKYDGGATFADDDLRGKNVDWMKYFQSGQPDPEWSRRLESIRDVLTSGGRTLAQGALGWIWARSPITIPIPGARTVEQAASNAAAGEFGPLSDDEFAQIQDLLNEAHENAE